MAAAAGVLCIAGKKSGAWAARVQHLQQLRRRWYVLAHPQLETRKFHL